jgi:hypothetical protein
MKTGETGTPGHRADGNGLVPLPVPQQVARNAKSAQKLG